MLAIYSENGEGLCSGLRLCPHLCYIYFREKFLNIQDKGFLENNVFAGIFQFGDERIKIYSRKDGF